MVYTIYTMATSVALGEQLFDDAHTTACNKILSPDKNISPNGGSLSSKAGRGKHRKYYRGVRNNNAKRGPLFNKTSFLEGDMALIAVSKGCYRIKTVSSTVGNNITTSCGETVKHCNAFPVLSADKGHLQIGSQVMALWDEADSLMKPVTVTSISQESIWVQDENGDEVRCKTDDICLRPEHTQKNLPVPQPEKEQKNCHQQGTDANDGEEKRKTSHMMFAIFSRFSKEYAALQNLYESAKLDLAKMKCEGDASASAMLQLTKEYTNSLSTIKLLQQRVIDVQSESSHNFNTLRSLITKQREELARKDKEILALNQEIRRLYLLHENEKRKFEAQMQQNQEEITRLKSIILDTKDENRGLQQMISEQKLEIAQLKHENQHLQREQNAEPVPSGPSDATQQPKAVQANQYELLSQRSSGIVKLRKSGSKVKGSTYVKLQLPSSNNSSAHASIKSLKQRSVYLKSTLDLLSGSDNDEDVIATLSQFMKMYPEVNTKACENAHLLNNQKLSGSQALDLKCLLRLPMNRLRELRVFLQKQNVNILPSDKQIYAHMSKRNTCEVEVGATHLKKTAAAETDSRVTFCRIIDLEKKIIDSVSTAKEMGDLNLGGKFEGSVWIKIGGDKGGSTTKLVLEICNTAKPNSADNCELIAMFEACEIYDNMENIFSVYKEQIVKIQEKEQITLNDGQNLPLRIFIVGDMAFLCEIFGHQGASSTYFCLWCHATLSSLRRGENVSPFVYNTDQGVWDEAPENHFTDRTPASMRDDYMAFLADVRNPNDKLKNGRYHNSVVRDQLLPIFDISQISPLPLHIMLGLGLKFFNMLEEVTKSHDIITLSERDESLDARWKELSTECATLQENLLLTKEALSEKNKLFDAYRKATSNIRGSQKKKKGRCDLAACAIQYLTKSDDDVGWVECHSCGAWIHCECVGLSLDDAKQLEIYECPNCKGQSSDDILAEHENNVKSLKKEISTQEENYHKKKSELNKVYEEVKKLQGPLQKELEDILENRLNVKRQAYHSHSFVGNHIQKILKQYELLTSVLTNYPDDKENFDALFRKFQQIVHCFHAKFLTITEVEDLEKSCWDFGMWFPKTFPKESIPPKLHILVHHIPAFAKKWNTVGILGEHGFESIHALINAQSQVYCRVKDKQQQMKLIFRNHGLRRTCDVSQISGIARKCKSCGSRYKKNREGIRKCISCGNLAEI